MNKKSIKTHLKSYSIFQKRKTTINHAFASALAPADLYEDEILTDALKCLGQDSNKDLRCVYCDKEAQTWDHLIGLVKDSELRGYGHQIGNLVPCCKSCNSKKGSKDWKLFLREKVQDAELFTQRTSRLEEYLHRFAKPIDVEQVKNKLPEDWGNYLAIKDQIFELMKEADQLAVKIRSKIKAAK
jgi:hypothetical protein